MFPKFKVSLHKKCSICNLSLELMTMSHVFFLLKKCLRDSSNAIINYRTYNLKQEISKCDIYGIYFELNERWNKSISNLFYFKNYIIFFNFNYQIRNDEHISCHIELRYKISIQKKGKNQKLLCHERQDVFELCV